MKLRINGTKISCYADLSVPIFAENTAQIESLFKFSDKVICILGSFEFVSGLFFRFYLSDSPLYSS